MIYAFEGFELDTQLHRLRRGGAPIRLDRKAFDTLRFLIENRGRVVHKGELLENLWPAETVVDGVVTAAIRRVRRALGQRRGAAAPIETAYGRGYCFVSETHVLDEAEHCEPAGSGASHAGEAEPWIGREAVLARLVDACRRAGRGEGSLVLLVGEAGIGKSRTALECARLARAEGASVWTARCVEVDDRPALWPWIQILRWCFLETARGTLRALPVDVLADLKPLVPEIRARVGPLPAPPNIGAEANRLRLYDSAAQVLRAAAAVRPRLLVLDDLHWADAGTLELLDELASRLPTSRLCVIGTIREDELPRPRSNRAWLERLASATQCSRIDLRGLSPREVAEYVARLTGQQPSPELTAAVHARTGGNPLFVKEVSRLLQSEWEERGREPSPAGIELPEAAKEAVRRRLRRLEPEVLEVLPVASTIGTTFHLSVLARAAQIDPGRLMTILEKAAQEDVLQPVAGATLLWQFHHERIREVLYEDVPPSRKAGLHLRVALAYEALGGASPHVLGKLALHFHHGLPHPHVRKAVDYARRMAQNAESLHAHEEAVRWYETALEAAAFDEEENDEEAELLLALGRARLRTGDAEQAGRTFDRVRELAQRTGSPALAARAELARRPLGQIWQSPPVLESSMRLRDLLHTLPAEERDLRARVLASLGMSLPQALSMHDRREMIRQALEIAGRSTDRETIVLAQLSRLHALQGPRDVVELMRAADEVQHIAREWELPELELVTQLFRDFALLTLGDALGAWRVMDRVARNAEKLRHPVHRWVARLAGVNRALARGAFPGLEGEIRALLQPGQAFFGPHALLIHALHVDDLYWNLGETHRLRDFDAARFRQRFGWAGSHLEAAVALQELRLGRRAAARRAFERLAADGFEGIPEAAGYLATLRCLALLTWELEDGPRAEILAQRLRPHAHLNAVTESFLSYGSVAFYLGLLEQRLGREASAVECFEQAEERHRQMDMWPMLARTRHALGRALLAMSGAAQRKRGRALLVDALELARELGMTELAGQIAAELARAA